jgi:asparagine synthase (glutamine-hydrolysing)
VQKFRPTAIRMGKQVKHRGPDWSGNHIANNTILVHERLSIVGVGKKKNMPPVNNNLKRAH